MSDSTRFVTLSDLFGTSSVFDMQAKKRIEELMAEEEETSEFVDIRSLCVTVLQ